MGEKAPDREGVDVCEEFLMVSMLLPWNRLRPLVDFVRRALDTPRLSASPGFVNIPS